MEISQKLIDEGYVYEKKHPTKDLWIYNYTHKAQFEGRTGLWEQYPELLQCRGLILDGAGNIVSRPFKKFFNFEEYPDGVPSFESFEVYDKLDGSLGIMYWDGEQNRIATRGSFNSEQALWATNYLERHYSTIIGAHMPQHTFLFEIIYPENRIVVDYKGKQELILLSIVENKTGNDYQRYLIETLNERWCFPLVEKFKVGKDFSQVREKVKYDGQEGFVIIFDTGLRVKLKYAEYVRLHRIVTGVSTKTIWEMLKEGQTFDEMLEVVPDEFHEWVVKTKNDLEDTHKTLEQIARNCVVHITQTEHTRKEQAQYIFANPYYKRVSSIVFSMLDHKPYKDIIWKMIKPKYKQPFQTRESV